ncbi:hypothetical protein HY642_01750 [Candidatus Woesearchaeota archaeon]|nr:hypothetical protein [Candidatus Woesearchaeota archaeon]
MTFPNLDDIIRFGIAAYAQEVRGFARSGQIDRPKTGPSLEYIFQRGMLVYYDTLVRRESAKLQARKRSKSSGRERGWGGPSYESPDELWMDRAELDARNAELDRQGYESDNG